MLKEERGSTLLLVLFIVLIFTMLGMAVLSASLGGAGRALVKEKDVQSLHIAEKVLNEAVAYIAAELRGSEGNITPQELQAKISTMEHNLKTNIRVNSANGSESFGVIDHIEVVEGNLADPESGITRKTYVISVHAVAEVNGVTRRLVQDITLDTLPDFIKYALGSNGDVYLNGTPAILGDLYTGGSLYVKNEAEFIYQDEQFREPGLNFPYLVNGDAYVQSLEDVRYCNQNCSSSPYLKLNTTSDPLNGLRAEELLHSSLSHIKIKDAKTFVNIDVKQAFVDKVVEAIGAGPIVRDQYLALVPNQAADRTWASTIVQDAAAKGGITPLVLPVIPESGDPEELAIYLEQLTAAGDLFNGPPFNRSMIVNGDLTIDGHMFRQLKYTLAAKDERDVIFGMDSYTSMPRTNWFIVDGDLTISNMDELLPIEVQANILVTGNLVMQGKIDVNATVITLGSTEISDAEIRGLMEEGAVAPKQMVLMTGQDLLITRVNSFVDVGDGYTPEAVVANRDSNRPKVLDGFFYTDSTATLYGVGSVFWINGGVFSKGDLTIHAVLGNTRRSADETTLTIPRPEDYPEGNREYKSRFLVNYNRKLFEDQHSALPRVKKISIQVGKKRLE